MSTAYAAWYIKRFGNDPGSDGQEVQTIRRETVNSFADWQEEPEETKNNAIASPQTVETVSPGPMTQREKEVLQSFCILSRSVMQHVYKYSQSADCICLDRARHPLASFEFSDAVLTYIKRAVTRSMIEDGKL